MAVGLYKLPICDGCETPWLPQKWTPESDPRDPARPLRCGKCKSSGWDRKHNAEAREEAADVQVRSGSEAAAENVLEMPRGIDEEIEEEEGESQDVHESLPSPNAARGAIRCKHRMTNCPICNPPEAE